MIRILCYGSQLVGGVFSAKNSQSLLGKRLLLFSAQLSQCRITLRLFDDLSMLAYSTNYGLGATEKDALVRWMSILNNVADQLYYPCEHIAWAADADLIKTKSDKWWVLSTVLWGMSLLLSILRSIRLILILKKKVQKCQRAGSADSREEAFAHKATLRRQIRGEIFSILSSLADLSNAIHWMPPGFLWAGRFPPWLVGLMGTTSSLISLLHLSSSDQGACS
ncbi:peroxisomal membrane protein 11C-like isoform X2 [Myxocyprinus asiaticus]|uniref:peroxisomal membrane protein 11C-like isoform X2 n=1 Tax=Myxocyprinus asiaticus TaxID=70543 RepID=UPI0022217188|nr:peroxisomal membrane protein 11C-like isoform X2 [Myxocyprinus asiaticus]XP_051529459.1 peroxisomal membrane protein 11C-like isoform X2 [Myxocyprinus asiaticus]